MFKLRQSYEHDEGWWILPAGATLIAGIGLAGLLGAFNSEPEPALDRSRPVVVTKVIDGGNHVVPPNVVVDDPDILVLEQGGETFEITVSEETANDAVDALESSGNEPITTVLEPAG